MSARVSSGIDSVQEVGTPPSLLRAVERRFGGPIMFDLAADSGNHVVDRWYGPGSQLGEDSLCQDWHTINGLLWLNPPYKKIGPWSKKCAEEAKLGARIVMLTPFTLAKWSLACWDNSDVNGLIPRVRFVGHSADFPKDLMVSVFGPDMKPRFQLWRWK